MISEQGACKYNAKVGEERIVDDLAPAGIKILWSTWNLFKALALWRHYSATPGPGCDQCYLSGYREPGFVQQKPLRKNPLEFM